MATLTYCGVSYTVDHAVRGADFIHGYDANGCPVVSFDGVSDFSGFTYDGTYMEPSDCAAEGCNDVKYIGGQLQTRNGAAVALYTYGTEDLTAGTSPLETGKLHFVYE